MSITRSATGSKRQNDSPSSCLLPQLRRMPSPRRLLAPRQPALRNLGQPSGHNSGGPLRRNGHQHTAATTKKASTAKTATTTTTMTMTMTTKTTTNDNTCHKLDATFPRVPDKNQRANRNINNTARPIRSHICIIAEPWVRQCAPFRFLDTGKNRNIRNTPRRRGHKRLLQNAKLPAGTKKNPTCCRFALSAARSASSASSL